LSRDASWKPVHHAESHNLGGEDPLIFPEGIVVGIPGLDLAYAQPGSLMWLYRMSDSFVFPSSGQVTTPSLLDSSHFDATARNMTYHEENSSPGWSTANRPTLQVIDHAALAAADDGCVLFQRLSGYFSPATTYVIPGASFYHTMEAPVDPGFAAGADHCQTAMCWFKPDPSEDRTLPSGQQKQIMIHGTFAGAGEGAVNHDLLLLPGRQRSVLGRVGLEPAHRCLAVVRAGRESRVDRCFHRVVEGRARDHVGRRRREVAGQPLEEDAAVVGRSERRMVDHLQRRPVRGRPSRRAVLLVVGHVPRRRVEVRAVEQRRRRHLTRAREDEAVAHPVEPHQRAWLRVGEVETRDADDDPFGEDQRVLAAEVVRLGVMDRLPGGVAAQCGPPGWSPLNGFVS